MLSDSSHRPKLPLGYHRLGYVWPLVPHTARGGSLRQPYLHKAQSKSKSNAPTNQSFNSNSSGSDNMSTAGDISDQPASSKFITDASSPSLVVTNSLIVSVRLLPLLPLLLLLLLTPTMVMCLHRCGLPRFGLYGRSGLLP